MKKNYSKNFELTVKTFKGHQYVYNDCGYGIIFVKSNGDDWDEMSKEEIIAAGIDYETVIGLQKKLNLFRPEVISYQYKYLSK